MKETDMNAKPQVIDIGDYDEQDDNTLLPVNDWIALYEMKHKKKLNAGTIRKRRFIAGLGTLVPPRIYLLNRAEFERVLATPLPFCNRTV
jgi:hypothetical protein